MHRDIKPENILLVRQDSVQIKLVDFNVSRIYDQNQHTMRTLTGTPQFRAPEMINMQPYGHKVDVWSCGLILYLLIFKQMPFETDDQIRQVN